MGGVTAALAGGGQGRNPRAQGLALVSVLSRRGRGRGALHAVARGRGRQGGTSALRGALLSQAERAWGLPLGPRASSALHTRSSVCSASSLHSSE